MYIHRYILGLSIFCFYAITVTAQVELDKLTNQEISQNKAIMPLEALTEYQRRYDRANTTKDKYELAKYLARANYLASMNKEVIGWQEVVDSLLLSLDEIPYDKNYEFLKVSMAVKNKKTHEAINILSEMEPQMLASQDTLWKINWYAKMANAYISFKDYAFALKYLLDAENLNHEFKHESSTAMLLNVKAALHWEKREMKKSLETYIASAAIYERLNDYSNLPAVYSNIQTSASNIGNSDIVLEYGNKLSDVHKKLGCQRCYFTSELNKILDLIQMGQYSGAITQATKVIAYADSTKTDPSHAIYLKGIAYRGLNQYPKAEVLIEKAFNLAQDIKHNGKLVLYSHALYQTYNWKEKYAPALKWHETYTTYKDSVYNEKKLKDIAVYESKLEALRQSQKVIILEAKVEADRQKKKLLWISLFLGSLIALSLIYAQWQHAQKEKQLQKSIIEKTQLEKEKLEQQLEFKQKELTTQILNMTQKNVLLKELGEGVVKLKNEENNHAVSRLVRVITRSIEDSNDWDQFLSTFKSIHSSFLASLNQLADNLTSNEIRLASLMKMNLSSKEIATILNVSDDGVKKARYRMRKKLNLESTVNVQSFLLGM